VNSFPLLKPKFVFLRVLAKKCLSQLHFVFCGPLSAFPPSILPARLSFSSSIYSTSVIIRIPWLSCHLI
jgi:hypothetical protein